MQHDHFERPVVAPDPPARSRLIPPGAVTPRPLVIPPTRGRPLPGCRSRIPSTAAGAAGLSTVARTADVPAGPTGQGRAMTSPVLLITRDELLLDDLLRLAAAAGTTLEVAHDSTAALRGWAAASVVLVGADQTDALAAHRPARRDGVHVVVHGP